MEHPKGEIKDYLLNHATYTNVCMYAMYTHIYKHMYLHNKHMHIDAWAHMHIHT